MPLDRAALWDSAEANQQWYKVILEVQSQGRVVAADTYLTREGTGQHPFRLRVPSGSGLPLSWAARLETARNVVSHDVEESFEGRRRGAKWPNELTTDFLAPWSGYQYHYPGNESLWQNEGVQLEGSHGSQSAFLVVTNPPAQAYSGFGLSFSFPVVWALPETRADWSRYSFAFDFKEKNGLAHVLELQVKDAAGRTVILTWYGNGQLQAANQVIGPWVDQVSARSPLRLNPAADRRYFRLRRR